MMGENDEDDLNEYNLDREIENDIKHLQGLEKEQKKGKQKSDILDDLDDYF